MTTTTLAIERELWTQCRRCGGLMVPDPIHESALDSDVPAPTEGRCVICGDQADELAMEQRKAVRA